MAEPGEIVEVTLLPADDGSDPEQQEQRRRRLSLVVVLAAALALALVALGVLGVQRWRDEQLTAGQEAAVTAVGRYTDGFDRHDLAAIRGVLADQASFAAGEHLGSVIMGPFRGAELDDFYRSIFRADVHLVTDGPVQVTGTGPWHVSTLQTVTYTVAGVPVTEQAVSLYTLLDRQDSPVVIEHFWLRPLATQVPSMLWAR